MYWNNCHQTFGLVWEGYFTPTSRYLQFRRPCSYPKPLCTIYSWSTTDHIFLSSGNRKEFCPLTLRRNWPVGTFSNQEETSLYNHKHNLLFQIEIHGWYNSQNKWGKMKIPTILQTIPPALTKTLSLV